MSPVSASTSAAEGSPVVLANDKELPRYLLRNHAEHGREPLCALLFLLDAVAFLRDVADRRALSRRDSSEPRADRPSTSETDEGGDIERWRDWLDWVREAYFASSVHTLEPADWKSPFTVPDEVAAPLSAWLSASHPALTAPFGEWQRGAVAQACERAIAYLQSRPRILEHFARATGHKVVPRTSGTPSVPRTLAVRRLNNCEASLTAQFEAIRRESADAPLPLDWQALQTAQSELLRARTNSIDGFAGDNVDVFRAVMSTVLEQHLGSSYFGQKEDSHGRIMFAAEAADDNALRDFSLAAASTPSAVQHKRRSSTTMLRQASLSIRRRDAEQHASFDRSNGKDHDRPSGGEIDMHYPSGNRAGLSPTSRRRLDPADRLPSQDDVSLQSTVSKEASMRSEDSTVPLVAANEGDDEDAQGMANVFSAYQLTNNVLRESQRPFANCYVLDSMPPTKNKLSSGQRRDLVRRSRKLQSMLGATLDEEAAQQTLVGNARFDLLSSRPVDAPVRSLRRQSYPPTSPSDLRPPSVSSQKTLRGLRSPESDVTSSPDTPDSRSDSDEENALTDLTSPEVDLKTPNDYDAAVPWGQVYFNSLESDVKARDERRRRMAKLQRFLGERIPSELVYGSTYVPEIEMEETKTKRNPTMFGSAFQKASSRFGMRAKSTGESRSSTDEGSDDSDLPRVPLRDIRPQRPASIAGHLSSEQAIASIRKARKLEKMFGTLPPADLYSPRILRPSHDWHFESDTVDDEDDDSLLRRRSSLSTARRGSIKALIHLHEHDPDTLDDLVRTMADETPAAASAGKAPNEVHEFESPADASPSMRHMSTDGLRQYARAAKLARIFGTTHRDVLKRVLEDLEQDLAEDADASDDEREEVKAGLRRLRAEAL